MVGVERPQRCIDLGLEVAHARDELLGEPIEDHEPLRTLGWQPLQPTIDEERPHHLYGIRTHEVQPAMVARVVARD